jgi:hypothetical protein
MALLEEMRALVGDLEAAFSDRGTTERERRVTATADGRERMTADRERRTDGAREARERLAEMAGRRDEIGELLAGFHAAQAAQAAKDAQERAAADRERVVADHERQAGAAADARERGAADRERRMTAIDEARERRAMLGETHRVWHDHSAAIAGLLPRPFPSGAAAGGRRTAAPGKSAVPLARHATAPARTAAQQPRQAGGRRGAGRKSLTPSSADIYAYLTKRPSGVKLTELESHFHVPRIVLSRAVREMIADKQVRRNERSRLYFAA